MKILLATNNKHKVIEIKNIISDDDIQLFTLNDLNLNVNVIEDKDSLEGNAVKKAKEVFEAANIPALADDTGLFVDAINGEPGVYSSRFAGENATYDDNCNKLIEKMNDILYDKRTAYFKTVVCYYFDKDKYLIFDGVCKGRINKTKKGLNGFGYDPLFIPDGFNKTFAEMNEEEKNKISHRAKAFIKARDYIINLK